MFLSRLLFKGDYGQRFHISISILTLSSSALDWTVRQSPHKKSTEIKRFRCFLVEISGIEPLTS